MRTPLLYYVGIRCNVPMETLARAEQDTRPCAEAIVEHWNEQGWSLKDAGEQLGISEPTARKIMKMAGKKPRTHFVDAEPEAVAA